MKSSVQQSLLLVFQFGVAGFFLWWIWLGLFLLRELEVQSHKRVKQESSTRREANVGLWDFWLFHKDSLLKSIILQPKIYLNNQDILHYVCRG